MGNQRGASGYSCPKQKHVFNQRIALGHSCPKQNCVSNQQVHWVKTDCVGHQRRSVLQSKTALQLAKMKQTDFRSRPFGSQFAAYTSIVTKLQQIRVPAHEAGTLLGHFLLLPEYDDNVHARVMQAAAPDAQPHQWSATRVSRPIVLRF